MSELTRLRNVEPEAFWRTRTDSPTDLERDGRVVEWHGSHLAAYRRDGGHDEWEPGVCGAEAWIHDGWAFCNTCGQRWDNEDESSLMDVVEASGHWVRAGRRFHG